MDSNSSSAYSGRRTSQSIYRPNFYRQRSVSCFENLPMDIEEEKSPSQAFHIRIVRRKSLGDNIKLSNNSSNSPVTVEEVNNKNELIIRVPVLNDDNGSITKDILIDKCDCEEPFPYGEPQMQSTWEVLKQMIIPFLIAGIGSVMAGIVLNEVQHWPAFDAIPQLIIMVPSFLGLIGNIETTLASRLSTHANLGTLDIFSQLRSMVIGNFAVVLCQASTVGLFAALSSLAMYYITGATQTSKGDLSVGRQILLLCSSSVSTSVASNIILATSISLVVIIARKIHINPDNIATPIAASMGDTCTIWLLAMISNFFFQNSLTLWVLLVPLIVLLLSAPVFGYIARKNQYTSSVILTGWTPILGAVIIEQPGGLVMGNAFDKYDVMSTFQPLVNGIGSNLVGIQTSRLSTFLHQTSPKGKLPKSNPRACILPFSTFIGSDIHTRMARLLLAITVPTHFLFLLVIRFWKNSFIFTVPFVISYMLAVLIQIALLLYLAYVSVLWAWKRHINPDNSAIPFTSALADVFGNCLMAAAFTFLHAINDPNAVYFDAIDTNSTILSTFSLNMTTVSTNNFNL